MPYAGNRSYTDFENINTIHPQGVLTSLLLSTALLHFYPASRRNLQADQAFREDRYQPPLPN